jgi:oxygen-independent coproporphyrinogen-3 oxidase
MYGLYIHIPFCKKKCSYCDFISYQGKEQLIPDYLSGVYREMEKYAGQPLTTIFVGGGTPTLLSNEQIIALMKKIRSLFSTRGLSEITFEANPESLTPDRLRALKTAGVNRLSIGLQSFSDPELEFLGRVHDLAAFKRAFATARQFGFANINVDLIYGLPHQTVLGWQKSLESLLSLDPEHISLYPLTIEEGTPFERDGVKVDDDLQAEIYDWSIDYLAGHGWCHYEISNWSKVGYKCRHNLLYWRNMEYIGVGAAAASYYKGFRMKNTNDIGEYLRMVDIGASPASEKEAIGTGKKLIEEVILNLRCMDGVTVSDEMQKKYGPIIENLAEKKLIEYSGQNMKLSRKGMQFANQVMKEFV